MNIKTIYILAGILLLITTKSCRSEELLESSEIPVYATDDTHNRPSSKSDSTSQEKEPEVVEVDPPKDRDNWKINP
ncbi:hypothetical protein [Chryseobacterium taiwanense]|uniref:Uncharacterized protein n=1 Tax=Chryseobacterium taiwanense TaxID=363331 RepID=A0A0B4E416_9FLAO|nr:hypothetical protein [Chryseobacterium taiwanense]KIC61348.1 hypothetical protein RM51_17885 [Chryseobacterium taiwanense]